MTRFYVIVHADDLSTMRENPSVANEINRIRKYELYVEVTGNPCVVDYIIPENSEIFVCGFYKGEREWDHRCVDEQIKALRRIGYQSVLYQAATVFLKP